MNHKENVDIELIDYLLENPLHCGHYNYCKFCEQIDNDALDSVFIAIRKRDEFPYVYRYMRYTIEDLISYNCDHAHFDDAIIHYVLPNIEYPSKCYYELAVQIYPFYIRDAIEDMFKNVPEGYILCFLVYNINSYYPDLHKGMPDGYFISNYLIPCVMESLFDYFGDPKDIDNPLHKIINAHLKATKKNNINQDYEKTTKPEYLKKLETNIESSLSDSSKKRRERLKTAHKKMSCFNKILITATTLNKFEIKLLHCLNNNLNIKKKNSINTSDNVISKKFTKQFKLNNKKPKTTETIGHCKQRKGQYMLRKQLLKIDPKCKICGVTLKDTLIASHIKDWNPSTDEERLNLYNVFLLCNCHDGLFDKKYITFDDNGKIIISSLVNKNQYTNYNISPQINIDIEEQNKKFLKWHRKQFKNKILNSL